MKTTAQILDEIVTRLQALTWTPAGGDPEDAEAAFGLVSRFSVTDLEQAFANLLTAEPRVALVVCTGRDWQVMEEGPKTSMRRTTQVSVVVSDRILGNEQAAWSGEATTPGAWGLADLVPGAICGRLLAAPQAVDLLPVGEQDVSIDREVETNLPGRAAVILEFQAIGGWLHTATAPGPAR